MYRFHFGMIALLFSLGTNEIDGAATVLRGEIATFTPDWMVSMRPVFSRKDVVMCGGSVIAHNLVLTAAHCLRDELQTTDFYIRGKKFFKDDANPGIAMKPVEWKKHEFFDNSKTNAYPNSPATYHHDVALIRVSGGESITDFISLDNDNGTFSALNIPQTIMGWGLDMFRIKTESLKTANVTVRNQTQCKNLWIKHPEEPFVLDNSFLCAGGPEDQANTGTGDSGGPMFTMDPKTRRYVQTGIVSWGAADLNSIKYPAALTRVSAVKSWIEENVRKMIRCSPGFNLTPNGLNCFMKNLTARN